MEKKNFLKRILAVALVIVLGISMSAQVIATTLSEAEREKAELEKQLASTQQLINELRDSKGNIEDKVSELNGQLIDISSKITNLENQLAEKSNQITDTQAQLEAAKADEQQQYEDMKLRIQYMYENSQSSSYIQMLLESRNVSDFLNTADYIAQIESYDRQKLQDYQATVEYVAGIEAQLEQDYADLQVMKTTVETEKQAVAALMNQKENELAGIAGNISEAQSEADYFEAEIQAQEEMIAEIKRIEAEKIAAGNGGVNPYAGGAFTWPCPSSTRITSDYGPRVSPAGGASSNHKGIDIGAAGGAAIVAAADGTVKAANYSSAAGNYVMIDHGSGLYTVYMHASALYVSEGDVVVAGETIAAVGSTGISTGNHLHFGVSLNGSYVSPWSYLGS